jgi:arylsulfatase A-like enzyme
MRFPLVVFAFSLLWNAYASTTQRPNFLLIAVDDLNHYTSEHIGQPDHFLKKVYPDEALRNRVASKLTPNLQRLASRSMIFTRAYCTSALCGPSRTSLFTGVPPHVSGYYQHQRHFRLTPSLREVRTLPQYLRANGYFTAGLGKVFHKQSIELVAGVRQDWPDTDHSWDLWIERRVGSGPDETQGSAPRERRNRSPHSPSEGLFTFGESLVPTNRSNDYANASFVASLLRQGRASVTDQNGHPVEAVLPNDKPFFLGLGLFMPHLPWNVPPEFLERFPVDEMSIDAALVDWVTEDVTDLPPGTARQWLGGDFDELMRIGESVHGPGGGVQAWRDALRHYLAAIAFADHCLGQIVDALESGPRSTDTIVMLWGDHGWQLGDKRRFRKQALWDAANHTEFLWRDPSAPNASNGTVCSQLVSLQDIYPTVVARAGLSVPTHVYGRDLAPLVRDPESAWDNRLLMTYNEGNHALRTLTHRYIRYKDGGRELYDLTSDPFERTNLAAQPSHAGEISTWDRRLDAMLARTATDDRPSP